MSLRPWIRLSRFQLVGPWRSISSRKAMTLTSPRRAARMDRAAARASSVQATDAAAMPWQIAHMALRRLPHGSAPRRVGQERTHVSRNIRGIVAPTEETRDAVAYDLGHAALGADHDRKAARLRLEDRHAVRLPERGPDEEVRGGTDLRQRLGRRRADRVEPACRPPGSALRQRPRGPGRRRRRRAATRDPPSRASASGENTIGSSLHVVAHHGDREQPGLPRIEAQTARRARAVTRTASQARSKGSGVEKGRKRHELGRRPHDRGQARGDRSRSSPGSHRQLAKLSSDAR